MKKQVDNKLAALIIFILVVIILVAIYYAKKPKNVDVLLDDIYKETTQKVVVVKVEGDMALVMDDNEKYPSIYRIRDGKERDYKQGNELLVYYDGVILESYPAQFSRVSKVEFVKEKSNTEIPESILRQCYSSEDNIRVTISELTNSSISLTIIDANEYPYNYSHDYIINKKVKNKNYPEKVQKLGEDTKNSIAGYTRNRTRIYLG